MKRCLLIGQTNVGKTLFMINLAEYLGFRQLRLQTSRASGQDDVLQCSLAQARGLLVGPDAHATQGLQTVDVALRGRKGQKLLQVVDSTGLMDGIHPDAALRSAMAQTLRALQQADVILHMLDAARLGVEGAAAIAEVDRQVARFAPLRGPYALIANKLDLPSAHAGLRQVRSLFAGQRIIAVSALDGRGFPEVKRFLWETL